MKTGILTCENRSRIEADEQCRNAEMQTCITDAMDKVVYIEIASDKSLPASFGELVSSVAIFGQAIYILRWDISIASSAQMCG